MTPVKTSDQEDTTVISPLAQDPTYGEKKYDTIFNKGLNFLLNLTASAALTYWVSHSKTPIRLPFMKAARSPSQWQGNIASSLQKIPKLGISKALADTMAGVLTLVSAGHIVMIPSVWLGAKYKSKLVEKWDKEHYGAEAMDDPTLKLRHATVAAEERPTLWGAIVGRAGTVVATQVVAYTIGNAHNVPGRLGKKFDIPGLKNFRGIDHFTELTGSKIGSTITETFPNPIARLNGWLKRKGFGWSNSQLGDHPELASLGYGTITAKGIGGGAPEHFGRYLISDISYTIVTALSIAPLINFFKRYIPGMTYTPKITAQQQATLDNAGDQRIQLKRPRIFADTAPEAETPSREPEREQEHSAAKDPRFSNNKPGARVTDIHNRDTVAAKPEHKLA